MVIKSKVELQTHRLAVDETPMALRLLEVMVMSEPAAPMSLSIGDRQLPVPPGIAEIFTDLMCVIANKGGAAIFVVDEGSRLNAVEAAKLAGMTHAMMNARQMDGKLPNSRPLAITVADVINLIEAEQGRER